ncbi:protein polybromo-1-like [Vigna umbellata]|uniref:protein polybromo-1-like n=1 Tax=Vigna umbellata TaxID=87088 RepID=UPI001F5E635B|nr:protein polybromo-1-like [Vigna umbellata]
MGRLSLHMIDNELDKPSKFSSSSFLPEKRILQLLLDTLQRKDTYEIFIEPVDPNEVEDYYAIIKEPMDFGTIRAKLHEKMYKTLEQFEHDVFQIFNNAMRFNSPGTIYFRQARVINELAKKVFDVLKKNPEKFEMEYSETRQKIRSINQEDFRNSRDLKSNEITSKTTWCSSHTSNKRSFKTNCLDAKDVKITIGTKECNKSKFFEIDRHGMYKPFYMSKEKSILPTINGELKLLQHVGQQDISYKDSLMMFAKDLGPIAQNIAKRKFLACEILKKASGSAPCKIENDTFNIFTTSSTICYHLDNVPSYPNTTSLTDNVDKEKGCNPLKGNTWECYKWCDKEFLSKRFYFEPCYS